jgi:hypothetical protein
MWAISEFTNFALVFGVLALFPTALALFFLRSSKRFCKTLSIVSLALAVIVPAFVSASFALASLLPVHHPLRETACLFAFFLIIPGAPVLAVAFIMSAFIAPNRGPGLIFLGAAAIECAVSMFFIRSTSFIPGGILVLLFSASRISRRG